MKGPLKNHGRLNMLPQDKIDNLVKLGEKTLIDYVFISCLIDAGASGWQYSYEDKIWTRSEGLAVAA